MPADHNLAPVTDELIRAGNALFYAATSLLGRGEPQPQVQDALANWRKLMECRRETH